jgi:hypothetical protein
MRTDLDVLNSVDHIITKSGSEGQQFLRAGRVTLPNKVLWPVFLVYCNNLVENVQKLIRVDQKYGVSHCFWFYVRNESQSQGENQGVRDNS